MEPPSPRRRTLRRRRFARRRRLLPHPASFKVCRTRVVRHVRRFAQPVRRAVPYARCVAEKISRLAGYGYTKVKAALLPRLPASLRKELSRLSFRWDVRRAAVGRTPPVLVYTAPKVASTAVTEALRAAGQPVFHVHMISPASMRSLRDAMRRRGLRRIRQGALGLEDIGNTIASGLIWPRRPARIVSLVRGPVARNISFYFETLNLLRQTPSAHERVSLEQLLAEFHERFRHERGVDWFDNEFKPVLGIDVYEHRSRTTRVISESTPGLTRFSSCGTTWTTA